MNRNKLQGIKVPRTQLLPPYLLSNPYFVEYVDAMDAVFGPLVDDKIEAVSEIRNAWIQNPATEATVEAGQLIHHDQWTKFEREILVKQANFLGMRLQSAGVMSDEAYQTIVRFVGQYWFGKGTQAFIEFINYCMSTDLRVATLWTEDYDTFLVEGSAGIGTPIWEGGTWYPTTHVNIIGKGGLGNIDIKTLQALFYEIANYNLVLKAIDINLDMLVVTELDKEVTDIVGFACHIENQVVVSNVQGFGANPPPLQELAGGTELPTSYMVPTGFDLSTAILLGKPSGWYQFDDGKKVPVYGTRDRHVLDNLSIGTQMRGYPAAQFNLLCGPVQWIKIPGSSKSTARFPSYSTSSFAEQDMLAIPTSTVGARRNEFLVNPVGFLEVLPGSFVPYW